MTWITKPWVATATAFCGFVAGYLFSQTGTALTNLDPVGSVPHDAFAALRRKWLACEDPLVNIVYERGDKISQRYDHSHRQRVYSLMPYSVWNGSLPHCKTWQEHLDSVHYGKRVHDVRFDYRFNDQPIRPYFVPYKCAPRWPSRHDLCHEVFVRFSHVILVGDSLTRHVFQAMVALLRDNLYDGGLLLPKTVPSPERCRCDGMFSEWINCRLEATMREGILTETCPNLNEQHLWFRELMNTGHLEGARALLKSESLCNKDTIHLPRVLVLGVGSHFSDAQSAWNEIVLPLFEQMASMVRPGGCLEGGTFHVIYHGRIAQARDMDVAYPLQSREHTSLFNAQMDEHLKRAHSNGTQLTQIHFWNLTEDAQTSDGMHGLSDVNMLKAIYILDTLAAAKTNV